MPLIPLLQIAMGVAWAIVALIFLPGVIRTWRNRADVIDVMTCPAFFVAVEHLSGAARWLLYPGATRLMTTEELAFWAGVYVLSIIAAGAALFFHRYAKAIFG